MSDWVLGGNRVCDGCQQGKTCLHPYTSNDGTTYYCTSIKESINDDE